MKVVRSEESHPEEVAEDLYGSNWNQQIDDVPDGFFSNYRLGSDLEMASQFDADAEEADAFSIDADKGLQTYLTVSIADNEFSPSELTLDAGSRRALRQ